MAKPGAGLAWTRGPSPYSSFCGMRPIPCLSFSACDPVEKEERWPLSPAHQRLHFTLGGQLDLGWFSSRGSGLGPLFGAPCPGFPWRQGGGSSRELTGWLTSCPGGWGIPEGCGALGAEQGAERWKEEGSGGMLHKALPVTPHVTLPAPNLNLFLPAVPSCRTPGQWEARWVSAFGTSANQGCPLHPTD